MTLETTRYYVDQPLEPLAVVAAGEGEGLRTVRIVPDGTTKSNASTFLIDAEASRLTVAAFVDHGVDLPIDFEHQSLGGSFAAPSGLAPAAGWIKKLWYEAGRGLLGLVAWNDKARTMIREGDYQYLSPVVQIRVSDRRVVALHSAALTNKPAIPKMEKLAASAKHTQGETMETHVMAEESKAVELVRRIAEKMGIKATSVEAVLQAVLAKLGGSEGEDDGDQSDQAETVASAEERSPEESVETPDMLLEELGNALADRGVKLPDGASREDVLKAALAWVKGESAGGEVAASVRAKLGLNDDAGVDEIVLAVAALETRFERSEADRTAKGLVDIYVDKGRINPNDTAGMEAAMSLAREHPERLKALMADAPYVYPPQGRTTAPSRSQRTRDKVIRTALSDHGGNDKLQGQTTREAFANLALRDAGLPALEDGEITHFC